MKAKKLGKDEVLVLSIVGHSTEKIIIEKQVITIRNCNPNKAFLSIEIVKQ